MSTRTSPLAALPLSLLLGGTFFPAPSPVAAANDQEVAAAGSSVRPAVAFATATGDIRRAVESLAGGEARRAAGRLPTVPDIDPLVVTPEMAAFLAERIEPGMQREARLRKLQESIFDAEEGLGITYGTHGTFTAAETFERAEGNCLSFTLLFVSLARHLGFVTHFVEVDEVTGWSRQGGVSFNHWHMFAEVEMANGIVQVDFLPWAERRYRARRRIEEPRVRAHFYNNVGAQHLTRDGGLEEARAHFQKALELDPTFSPAKLNLAVVERRADRPARAEALLLEILESEPESPQAATNLANLYGSLGREAEAERWQKRRRRFLRQNPFHHFRLGLVALQADEPRQAAEHFRRAVVRQADEAVFHQHLAEAYYRLGRKGKAKTSLERALEHAEEPDRKTAIENALAKLGGGV